MLRAAARKAALRTSLMYIGERPIAFAYGILSNHILYATFTGYDPEFKKYAPGLQTIMHFIEQSIESNGGLVRLDAGCGDFSFKRALFSSSWQEAPVWIFAPTAKGAMLHVLKLVSTLLHSLAMRALAKSDALRKVKKMWRQYALRKFQRASF
jgi:CelD/BcsL family acetyltransferase involved in cellulose biosynthesis